VSYSLWCIEKWEPTSLHSLPLRDALPIYQEARDPAGDQTRRVPVLSVKGLTVPGVFEDVSFDVYPGEIVGIGGLVGAGGNEIGRDRKSTRLNSSHVKTT